MDEVQNASSDEHYVDLPREGAENKILKWNERIAKGLTCHPRSALYFLGKASTADPEKVGVYLRKCPV